MKPVPTNPPVTRRDFIQRLMKAGVLSSAICALGLWRYDSKGPVISHETDSPVMLPDFSVVGKQQVMSIVSGPDRIRNMEHGLNLLGGLGTFIHPGDRVLIKVNAAFATPPILSATTHPESVARIIHLCFKAGASSVAVTDNPINDPSSCFSLTGIAKAAEDQGAKVMLPKDNGFRQTSVTDGKLIKNWPLLFTPFQGINKLIGMAPVKDHHRSGASMIMKNWYGLLGGRRNIFHQDIQNIIKELAMMVSPTLVILDGTTTMMTNGPTGGSLNDLKHTQTMIISTDQVAADAFGATLLGKTAADLPYIKLAEAQGVGTSNYQSLNPFFDTIS
jgi:uncharacterized protein (DUF362 family)